MFIYICLVSVADHLQQGVYEVLPEVGVGAEETSPLLDQSTVLLRYPGP